MLLNSGESPSQRSPTQGTSAKCGAAGERDSAADGQTNDGMDLFSAQPSLEGLGDEDDEYLGGTPPIAADAVRVGRIAGPAAATQLLRVCNYTLVLLMSQRLTPAEFGGLVLGTTVVHVVIHAPCAGIAAVLDTLVPREFGLDPASPAMGLHLRRGILACVAWTAAAWLLLAVLGRLLLSALVDAELVDPAVGFVTMSALTALPMVCTTCWQKFLTAQRLVHLPLVAQCVSTAALVTLLAVTKPAHVTSVALAIALGRTAGLAALIVLAWRSPNVRIRFGRWSRLEVFEPDGVKSFARLAAPSLAICCAERWSFEGLSLIAATLGTEALDAWAMLSNAWLVCFAIATGFYAAANTLVGNALGQSRASAARRVARRTVVMYAVIGGAVCGLLAVFADGVFAWFPGTPAARGLAARLGPLVACGIFADTTAFVLQGVLRAASDVTFVAWLSLAVQWMVTAVLAPLLAWEWRSLRGLTVALSVGSISLLLAMAVRADRLKWMAIVQLRHEARQRGNGADGDVFNVSMASSAASGHTAPHGERTPRPQPTPDESGS